jgi:hypothetical protein
MYGQDLLQSLSRLFYSTSTGSSSTESLDSLGERVVQQLHEQVERMFQQVLTTRSTDTSTSSPQTPRDPIQQQQQQQQQHAHSLPLPVEFFGPQLEQFRLELDKLWQRYRTILHGDPLRFQWFVRCSHELLVFYDDGAILDRFRTGGWIYDALLYQQDQGTSSSSAPTSVSLESDRVWIEAVHSLRYLLWKRREVNVASAWNTAAESLGTEESEFHRTLLTKLLELYALGSLDGVRFWSIFTHWNDTNTERLTEIFQQYGVEHKEHHHQNNSYWLPPLLPRESTFSLFQNHPQLCNYLVDSMVQSSSRSRLLPLVVQLLRGIHGGGGRSETPQKQQLNQLSFEHTNIPLLPWTDGVHRLWVSLLWSMETERCPLRLSWVLLGVGLLLPHYFVQVRTY